MCFIIYKLTFYENNSMVKQNAFLAMVKIKQISEKFIYFKNNSSTVFRNKIRQKWKTVSKQSILGIIIEDESQSCS